MKKALHFEKIQDDYVKCVLCPRECVVKSGQAGYCRGRENREGEMYAKNYAQVSAVAMDPIEKKPLYHFYPGREILSVGTVGCNLGCKFCQNWHIAHKNADTREVLSDELVGLALERDSVGIAYTYSEPLVWYEYILDTAKKAHEVGLKNVLVSNGLIHREPLLELLKYIDGVNLDVKAFRQEFYQEVCGGGNLEAVKETARLVAEHCHLEVTTLLIPGLNDAPGEVRELAEWLGGISADIPIHFSRYFPQYKLNLPPTPVESLQRAKEVAGEYLHYIYLGNVPNEDRDTYCHRCHYRVIRRDWEVKVDLFEGYCPECGTKIPVVL